MIHIHVLITTLLSRASFLSLISFFEVLTRITGCASWTEYDIPYDKLLQEAGISVPEDFCSVSVPICTGLKFSDGFDEALSELASQLGDFVSSSLSGRRLIDYYETFCSDFPGITFGLKFNPAEWPENRRGFFSLEKMRFTKLAFSSTKYMIHLTDLSLTPTASLQFDLKWPCGGSPWHIDIRFQADIRLSINPNPSSPKSILKSVMEKTDTSSPEFMDTIFNKVSNAHGQFTLQ